MKKQTYHLMKQRYEEERQRCNELLHEHQVLLGVRDENERVKMELRQRIDRLSDENMNLHEQYMAEQFLKEDAVKKFNDLLRKVETADCHQQEKYNQKVKDLERQMEEKYTKKLAEEMKKQWISPTMERILAGKEGSRLVYGRMFMLSLRDHADHHELHFDKDLLNNDILAGSSSHGDSNRGSKRKNRRLQQQQARLLSGLSGEPVMDVRLKEGKKLTVTRYVERPNGQETDSSSQCSTLRSGRKDSESSTNV